MQGLQGTPEGDGVDMTINFIATDASPTGYAYQNSQKSEADPHGKAPNEPGAKLDSGKNRLGLVLGDFARSLEQVGHVGTFGAGKYSDGGWVDVPDGINRYTDAMLRHWLAEQRGEVFDPETKLMHAAHLAWNALSRLDLMLRDQQ